MPVKLQPYQSIYHLNAPSPAGVYCGYLPGTLSVSTQYGQRGYVHKKSKAGRAYCRVGTAPTGASLIVSFRTVVGFALIATVTITAGNTSASTASAAIPVGWVYVVISQVGSTVPGADLSWSVG